MSALSDLFLYLLAAVITVPVANRLGLGSVLGYLIAGVALAPILGLMDMETEALMHFSEFGIVMMLFLIGLELRPREVWTMRHALLGMGGAQLIGTIMLIGGGSYALGLDWRTSLAVGMVLALSSTAIVMQTLKERGLDRRRGGRAAFAVLLFQDIAVIPMLALLPLLAVQGGVSGHAEGAHHASEIFESLPAWAQALAILGSIGAIILAGRFLAYPVFRFIASGRSQEVFLAAALALVIGTAMLVSAVGLSPALGAFLAGVVLSGSEYRHQLESDIAPLKGLLLGIFFISVGAGVDFALLAERPFEIVGLALAVIFVKALVLALISFRKRAGDRWLFTLSLPQAGEFGFVLIAIATAVGVFGPEVAGPLTLIIAVTMFLTPLFFVLYERVINPRLLATNAPQREPDEIPHHGVVVIAGVGRFGQVVNRLLRSAGIETVVVDQDEAQLETVRRFGISAYYGDASRLSLLESAGIEKARVFVATLGDIEQQLTIVKQVRRNWPHVHVIARANDRGAAYRLLDAGAHRVVRELFAASIETGRDVLTDLGIAPSRADRLARAFRGHDEESFSLLREHWTQDFSRDPNYLAKARERADQLRKVMTIDEPGDEPSTTRPASEAPPDSEALRTDRTDAA